MVHIDRDLWDQRRRDRINNGNGNGGHGHIWSKLPWSALVTLLLALVAWVVSSVLWLARMEADLQTVKSRDAELHAKVNLISNQLDDISRRIGVMDERQTSAVLRNNAQDERMERIESQGSRRVPIIEERQQQLIRRLDAIVQYLQQNSNFRLQSEEPRR